MYSLQNKLSILLLLVIIFVESANGLNCLHALNYTLFNQTKGGKPPMFVLTAEEKKCDLENMHCFTVDFETENGRGFYKGCTSKYNTSEQCNEDNKKFDQKNNKTTILDMIRGEKSGILSNLTKISNCRLCNDSKEKQCNAGILCHHGVNQSFGLFEKKEMISKMTVTQCNDDEQCMKLECPNEYASGVYKGCAPKMITSNKTLDYTTEFCAKQFTCKMKVLVDDELDKKKSKPPNSVCNLCHGKNMCNGAKQPLPIKFAGFGGLLFIAGGIVLLQQKLQHLL